MWKFWLPALALGIVALVAAYRRPAPATQFRLLGFQRAEDAPGMVVDGVRLRRTISRADSVAFAWVDLGSHRPKDLNQKLQPGDVLFALEAKNGDSFPLEANVVSDVKQTSVACINFLPGSGGSFVDPWLVASIDGREVARWPLPNYPTDTLHIPADEPTVTRIDDVLGFSIEATATKTVQEKFVGRETGFVNLHLRLDGQFPPDLEVWLHHSITESTWRKERYWSGGGSRFTEPRSTSEGQGAEFAAYADRVRVVGDVEVRQSYEEAAVFRGLLVLRDPRTGQLAIANRREQRVVLSTGLEVVMPVFQLPVEMDPSGQAQVGFNVTFPQGTQNLDLPGAQNVLRSTHGVSLSFGKIVANTTWSGAGGGISRGGWAVRMLVDPKSVKAGVKFDVSLGVKHHVVVGKKEFQLLVPLQRLDG
ncbi:MAG: hypothetical protein M9921_05340 [Fimbriimonadaceae bacterium]|nr:hypothetical protein [Chthonomonadaceae bacterium]MCO5296264.1 hypothetical protein [Fimbriimonadaceae bacterium]